MFTKALVASLLTSLLALRDESAFRGHGTMLTELRGIFECA